MLDYVHAPCLISLFDVINVELTASTSASAFRLLFIFVIFAVAVVVASVVEHGRFLISRGKCVVSVELSVLVRHVAPLENAFIFSAGRDTKLLPLLI